MSQSCRMAYKPQDIFIGVIDLFVIILPGAVLLFALLYWFSSRKRPPYTTGGLFLLLYGLARFGVEFAREPDQHIGFVAFGWLTRGQLLSMPMILLGVAMLVFGYRKGLPVQATSGRRA